MSDDIYAGVQRFMVMRDWPYEDKLAHAGAEDRVEEGVT